jgi:hypothetical protein
MCCLSYLIPADEILMFQEYTGLRKTDAKRRE